MPLTATPIVSSNHLRAKTRISLAPRAGLPAEHWLRLFMEDLISRPLADEATSFEAVERLLQQRKDDFLRDFLTARRMYRTYPHLFPEI